MSFAPMQRQVDEWIREHTHGYFQPLQMIARMTEELGELARTVSYRFGEKKPKPGEQTGDIADELCDVIFVSICLANATGIDLDRAWEGLVTKLYQRDVNRWKP
jgi:NTP pyrophosphatase (non-canonical NTP hydrolase)